MLFNSLEYAVFLVIVFLVYWSIYRMGMFRIVFLLVASYLFYAASNPWFLLLLAGSTVTDFFAGLAMHRAHERGEERKKKVLLIFSLCVNLGLLATFKYSNFFYESFVDVAGLFGVALDYQRLDIMLPAGISFYTFQTMSYTIDLYRGRCPVEKNFLNFALFVGFFPQLVAGPIVRAVDFLPQIRKRPALTPGQVSRAFWLIGLGLMKKAFGDMIGLNMVDPFFEEEFPVPGIEPGSLAMLVALYAYTMQIYLDFSAYSDIAIGSGLLLGYRLPDNFNRPYKATSIQDFWRRWHLTLGSWLRDYLYYPLGGSRGTFWRTNVNLFITFVLIGLWHGPSWNFVVYGCLHATAMCVHRFFRVKVAKRQKPKLNAWGLIWRVFVTLHFVVLARIFFRAKDFDGVGQVTDRLFAFDVASDFEIYTTVGGRGYDLSMVALLILCFLIHWTPRDLLGRIQRWYEQTPFLFKGVALCAFILISMQLVDGAVPFKYFQF